MRTSLPRKTGRVHPGSEPRPSPRVCVIGAGCCGLTSLKALSEQGLSPVGFEMGSDVGGLWVFRNSNGRGGAYRSLHINTSTQAMAFSDFPMSEQIGDFPHHTQVAHYLKDYADHFQLLPLIRFEREVVHCEPISCGDSGVSLGYRVSVRDRRSGQMSEHFFDAVVVANGHHWSQAYPRPNPAAGFSGITFHSGDYQDPSVPYDLVGKDVVVVGVGNSAVDIACELVKTGAARSVTLSCRRGVWVLPKYLFGKPIDQGTLIPRFLPDRLRRLIATRSFELIFGKMSSHGLMDPDHLIGEAHPTISSDLPGLVREGHVAVSGAIDHCKGSQVCFSDGSTKKADAIVFATGYDIAFPFFSRDHIKIADNSLPLFLRAFHLEHRRVFFVGLLQTVGAVMPSAEAQARLVARHIAGQYNLPTRSTMEAEVRREEQKMRKRFVHSRRHTMQVIPEDFLPQIEGELVRGSKRAARREGTTFSAAQSAKTGFVWRVSRSEASA